MRRVVIFQASPRSGGNTRDLVKQVLKEYGDVTVVHHDLRDYEIGHCTGCLACNRTGECVIQDDMVTLYRAADEADLLIFATPVYFNSVTSVGKAVIDRFERNYARRFRLMLDPKVVPGKEGLLVMTAGSRERNRCFDGVRKPIDLFFKSNGIVGFGEVLLEGLDEQKNG